ncbi:MAG: CDP-alcohol phosphatidyltransferase family protein [Chitinophagaceae bacterium]
MKQIPNLFTLLNLVFGCFAIVFALQNGISITGNEDGQTWINIPEKIWYASLFIGLAAVVDFLDGFIARLFNATSEMGRQLDSLADVVSFGAAPGIILYQFLRLSIARESSSLDMSLIWIAPAFIVPCAAAWRLARFNTESGQQDHFKGMPVPAAGIFVASLPLIYWNVNEESVQNLLLNKWVLYGVIVLLSWLMVSSLPVMTLKFKDFSLKNNWPKLALVIIAAVSFVLLKWLAVPLAVLAYVLISLLLKNKTA